jgi:hypothetical protein
MAEIQVFQGCEYFNRAYVVAITAAIGNFNQTGVAMCENCEGVLTVKMGTGEIDFTKECPMLSQKKNNTK